MYGKSSSAEREDATVADVSAQPIVHMLPGSTVVMHSSRVFRNTWLSNLTYSPAIANANGHLILNSSSVFDNNGGGLFAGIVGMSTLINSSIFGNSPVNLFFIKVHRAVRYPAPKISALLPVSLGHYADGTTKCTQAVCREAGIDGKFRGIPCPDTEQICDYERFENRQVTLLPAHMLWDFTEPWPPMCSAGYLGNATAHGGRSLQTNSMCAGPCPRGHFCPVGTSTSPPKCPAGTTSQSGATKEADCQKCWPGFFAASQGSPRCTLCPAPLQFQNATGQSACKECPPGHWCTSISAAVCPIGSWCSAGVKHLCPAGTLGDRTGLAHASCGRMCPLHHYCPIGATAALVCPPGTVGAIPGLQHRSNCTSCPKGHWVRLRS